jgi:hypothetical protein
MIPATEVSMSKPAEVVELVVLNGRIAVDGAEHTGALAGRVLRRI